jgi:hypothetical protein
MIHTSAGLRVFRPPSSEVTIRKNLSLSHDPLLKYAWHCQNLALTFSNTEKN